MTEMDAAERIDISDVAVLQPIARAARQMEAKSRGHALALAMIGGVGPQQREFAPARLRA